MSSLLRDRWGLNPHFDPVSGKIELTYQAHVAIADKAWRLWKKVCEGKGYHRKLKQLLIELLTDKQEANCRLNQALLRIGELEDEIAYGHQDEAIRQAFKNRNPLWGMEVEDGS